MIAGERVSRLVREVAQGKDQSRTDLYQLLSNSPQIRAVIRRLSYNTACIDKDDIDAEFWAGVVRGMDTVNPKIGDPIAHLIQHGVWQVKSIVRTEITKRIYQFCSVCCDMNKKYSYSRICDKCGGNVENMYRIQPLENEDLTEYIRDIGSITVDEIKGKTDKKFHALIDAIYDGCKNCDESKSPLIYAASKMGVSKQRVSFLLNQMRRRLTPA